MPFQIQDSGLIAASVLLSVLWSSNEPTLGLLRPVRAGPTPRDLLHYLLHSWLLVAFAHIK